MDLKFKVALKQGHNDAVAATVDRLEGEEKDLVTRRDEMVTELRSLHLQLQACEQVPNVSADRAHRVMQKFRDSNSSLRPDSDSQAAAAEQD